MSSEKEIHSPIVTDKIEEVKAHLEQSNPPAELLDNQDDPTFPGAPEISNFGIEETSNEEIVPEADSMVKKDSINIPEPANEVKQDSLALPQVAPVMIVSPESVKTVEEKSPEKIEEKKKPPIPKMTIQVNPAQEDVAMNTPIMPSMVDEFDMPMANDEEELETQKVMDDSFSKTESVVQHKSIVSNSKLSKQSRNSKNLSKGEPQYPQTIILQTPTLPPSKTRQRSQNKISDFNPTKISSVTGSQQSINIKRPGSQTNIPERLPSPDSMAFDLDNQFMDLGTPKRQRSNNSNLNVANLGDNLNVNIRGGNTGGFNAPGLSMGGSKRNSRRNSSLHMRFNNKITPIMISKFQP